MKLFQLTFPHPAICSVANLYYRSEAARYDGCLLLPKDETVSFDTFFNLFSCGKYIRHTTVKNVTLCVDVEGSVDLKVFHVEGEPNINCCWAEGISLKRGTVQLSPKETPSEALVEREIATASFASTARRTESISLDISPYKAGYIYFAVTAQTDAKIYGGYYQTEVENPRPVKVGLVICTYKREEYVKNNVANINSYLAANPDLKDSLSVFVVDNGQTLHAADVPGATLIPNKNLGGSGGFARGMIEVCSQKQFTHVLLSDDDVVYQPEMFRKTITLLQTAQRPSELAVGAAMLRLDRPNVQFEFGATWKKQCIHANTLHCGFDLTKQAALITNENLRDVDYSAWWYMCMPVEKIAENGFPMPFFIKQDDIEYSARCHFEIALINGIGLWHESFVNKYSAFLEYYSMRNLLIADCLTKRSGGGKAFRWVITNVAIQLVYQRYFTLPFIFDACNDFLKGAERFSKIDGEALNKKLLAANLKQKTKQQLESEGYDLSKEYLPKNRKTLSQVLSLNGQLIPPVFYPKQNRNYQVVDMRYCYPRQFYKCQRVVQYNPVTQTGFVTKQRFFKLFQAGFKLVGLGIKMMFCYKKAARSYRKKYKELTSLQNWQKLLDLSSEE